MSREREIQDHYFRQAKRDGYLSRAAYKLIEIDDRRKILRKGDYVLDCGSAPGSWLQVVSKRVGAKGRVMGIDLRPIRHQFPIKNVSLIEGDFCDEPVESLLPTDVSHGDRRLFDVVLSDMAPSTTGDRNIDHHQSIRLCHSVLDRCSDLLAPGRGSGGGSVVMKVLEGEAYPELLARVRRLFDSAKGFKPKASRAISTEIFLIGQGYRGPDEETRPSEAGDAHAPGKRKPSPGWGAS